MTRVVLARDADGALASCSAQGHAGFSVPGYDIVCAAESILLRTAVSVLEGTAGVRLRVDASRRGSLSFSVEASVPEARGRLECVADFIQQGVASLAQEYPACVRLQEI